MTSVNDERLESSLLGSVKDLGALSVQKVTSSPAIGVGLNHCSRLLRLSVDFDLGSGEGMSKSFILKQIPEDQKDRECVEELDLFPTEINIFNLILKKMESMLPSCGKGYPDLLFWPKMYGTDGQNWILLEDLKAEGFITVTGRELTKEEGLLTMRALGRFHGMSVVLNERGLIDVTPYPDFKIGTEESIVDFVFGSSLNGVVECAKTTWSQEWRETAEKLESVIQKIKPALKKLVESTRGKYDVLNHGDFWGNNIMYKHSNGKATDLRIIDFQLCHYNSFAWDLVHFIYCVFVPSSREKYKQDLIREYQRSLEETLVGLGTSRRVPSVEEVSSEVDALRLQGLLFSVSTVPRLMPVVVLTAQALCDAESAQRKRVNMFSIPEVANELAGDLRELADMDIRT